MSQIYLDHAATTAMHPAVLEAMLPYYSENYYNPSTAYQAGKNVRKQVEEVRELIAWCIHAEPEEIYFTSGGTEGDNWFLSSCLFREHEEERPAEYLEHSHLITSCIEHHAVLYTCEQLARQGCKVTYLPVDSYGRISLEELEDEISDNTRLISIMYANNEIGTIQPVEKIGALAKKYGIPFHTDGVQACGHVPFDVKKENISAFSASSHKFAGPKGVGFLYVSKELPLHRMLYGGGQERGKRAGTENVPGIIGMGKALELAQQSMKQRMEHETELRDYLIRRIRKEIPDTRVNGHMIYRLPNNINVAFRFIHGASLLILLDTEEICVSSGSACNSDEQGPSHVIQALHLPKDYENGVIRMTLGEENTIEEMEQVVQVLKRYVQELRQASPEYEENSYYSQ